MELSLCVLQLRHGSRGPKIARGGNYFKAWTLANGEFPRKGQPMSPEVFQEGQIYTVEVKDSRQKFERGEKLMPRSTRL